MYKKKYEDECDKKSLTRKYWDSTYIGPEGSCNYNKTLNTVVWAFLDKKKHSYSNRNSLMYSKTRSPEKLAIYQLNTIFTCMHVLHTSTSCQRFRKLSHNIVSSVCILEQNEYPILRISTV